MNERLTSAGGIVCLLLAAFAACPRGLRGHIDRRTLLGGLGLGPRAMLGGLLTTCLVACVAGVVL